MKTCFSLFFVLLFNTGIYAQIPKYYDALFPDKVYLGMPVSELDMIRAAIVKVPSPKNEQGGLKEKAIDRIDRGAFGRNYIYFVRNNNLAGALLTMPASRFEQDAEMQRYLGVIKNTPGLIFTGEEDVVRSGRDMNLSIVKAMHFEDKNNDIGIYVVSTTYEFSVYLFKPEFFDGSSFFAPPASLDKLSKGVENIRKLQEQMTQPKSPIPSEHPPVLQSQPSLVKQTKDSKVAASPLIIGAILLLVICIGVFIFKRNS